MRLQAGLTGGAPQGKEANMGLDLSYTISMTCKVALITLNKLYRQTLFQILKLTSSTLTYLSPLLHFLEPIKIEWVLAIVLEYR